MGYSRYMGSKLIPNSLGLGREAVLQEYSAWVFPLAQPPRRKWLGVPLFETLGPRVKRDLRVGGQ
jgi:hypothetical protein